MAKYKHIPGGLTESNSDCLSTNRVMNNGSDSDRHLLERIRNLEKRVSELECLLEARGVLTFRTEKAEGPCHDGDGMGCNF